MADPLPPLVENSLEVAWNYLEGLGEISDPQKSAECFEASSRDIEGGDAYSHGFKSCDPSPSAAASARFMIDPCCPRCLGLGWVCENHPDRVWMMTSAVSVGRVCRADANASAWRNLIPRR
jgi:hypothetical protein